MSDADQMIRNWISNPDVQNNDGEPVYVSKQEVDTLLGKWIDKYQNDDFYKWAIELNDSHENIGQIAFYKVNKENFYLDVEYCVGKPYWGNGYATEALTAVIDYAFEKMEYNRVQAFHRSKNQPSGRVLEKAGMKIEGILRKFLFHNNNFDDCVLYAVLKEEWKNSFDDTIR